MSCYCPSRRRGSTKGQHLAVFNVLLTTLLLSVQPREGLHARVVRHWHPRRVRVLELMNTTVHATVHVFCALIESLGGEAPPRRPGLSFAMYFRCCASTCDRATDACVGTIIILRVGDGCLRSCIEAPTESMLPAHKSLGAPFPRVT